MGGRPLCADMGPPDPDCEGCRHRVEASVEGPWVTYFYDPGVIVASIHQQEIQALRAAVSSGHYHVIQVPWGRDIGDYLREVELAGHSQTSGGDPPG